MTTATTPTRRRRGGRAFLLGVVVIGLVTAGSMQVSAAPSEPPSPAGQDGWVRLAHLSPDTAEVNVQLTALSGGAVVFSLGGVGYGAVSDYVALTPGTYVVSMVPTATPDAAPAISSSVNVEQGKAATVAAYGRNRDLAITTFQDDLGTPEPGTARVRIVQASTTAETVDVQTSTGVAIATDAAAGSATSYASVPAGSWDLELTGSGLTDVVPVQLANGSVNTLFVLDTAQRRLTVKAVLDGAAVGAAPIGGVQTGGGGLPPARDAAHGARLVPAAD
jgi:hypothetical protein